MKNLIRFVLIGVMTVCAALAFVACSDLKPVSAPSQLTVNDRNVLSWHEVANARSYTVDIKTADGGKIGDFTARRASYSLSSLEEGDYVIAVKAISGDKTLADSDWSKALEFHKDYETGCVYELYNANREYKIVRYGSASGDLVIEDEYRGKPVTRIDDMAFRSATKITSITLGKNVTYVGDYAFMNCVNMKSATLPEGLSYLGEGAFYACRSLESFTVPAGVTAINDYTFAYCRGLTSLSLGENATSIGASAATACSSLTEAVVPDKVKTIGEYAFSSCTALEKVTLGKALESIDQYAFSSNDNLALLVFNEDGGLKSIGESAFRACAALTEVSFPATVEEILTRAFYGCGALETVTIPENVTKIGTYCFHYTKFYNDQNVDDNGQGGFIYADKWVIGKTAATANDQKDADDNIVSHGLVHITTTTFKADTFGIADRALASMGALSTVNLNVSIKYVGELAFYNCRKLAEFSTNIGGVKEIGARAFYGCDQLTVVKLRDGLETIGEEAFRGCINFAPSVSGNLTIPDTVTRVGRNAFYETLVYDSSVNEGPAVYVDDWVVGSVPTSAKVDVTLKEGTTGIADYAFNGFETLRSVSGLDAVSRIGIGAFRKCTSLESVTLSRNLKEINDYVFSLCSSLYNVNLPSSLTSVGKSAFYKCTSLGEIDLSGTKTTSIGDTAFYGCTNLKRVDLNSKNRGVNVLESIGVRAFYGCTSLGANLNVEAGENGELIVTAPNDYALEIPSSVRTVSERAFYGCSALENVTFNEGLEEIGVSAFAKNVSLKKIILPSTLKRVEKNAFFRCYDVTELELGGTEYVGDFAFEGLSISSLTLTETLDFVGKYAFRRMKSLISVTLSAGVEVLSTGVFYECKAATIYTDADKNNDGWDMRFNPSFRPVVYGAVLSGDGTFVTGLTTSENGVIYADAANGVTEPKRKGYAFKGWATDNGGEAVYCASEIASVEVGVTLYAVWSDLSSDIAAEEERDKALLAPKE